MGQSTGINVPPNTSAVVSGNENNFSLFNQFQSSSVVDVLKHLSLDQDDFNMFSTPAPMTPSSLMGHSGFNAILNGRNETSN